MFRIVLSLSVVLSVGSGLASGAEFPGWRGLRVIEQKGRPRVMRTGDIDADGRDELLVVNSRFSRLDIYSRPADLAAESSVASNDPNELPFAQDMRHQELQLESVPRDVLVQDLDADGQPELVVLVASPDEVVVYRRAAEEWQKSFTIDLLDGDLPTRYEALLIREIADGEFQLLVSLDDGIQQLALTPSGRAEWLTPREQRGRVAWWLADLDGDGRDDLVEQTRDSNEAVRWYRAAENGTITPAAVLVKRSVDDAVVLRRNGSSELLVLDGTASGILRRYRLSQGEENPFGVQHPLALEAGPKAVWCGMQLGDEQALVVADSEGPRLLTYTLGEAGWQAQQAYPAVTDVQALATLPTEPGTLLLWTKDAAELRRSRWENGRLSYPEAWQGTENDAERKVLALQSVGGITWWVQRVEKDLVLSIARPGAAETEQVEFEGLGARAEEVLWIGGQRLLVKEARSRALQIYELADGKAKKSAPSHLAKASLEEFKLLVVGEQTKLGRITDGVLQWLDDELRSYEQVMLPPGQELADYVATSQTTGWALQQGSEYLHRIEINDARLSRSVERIKVGEGLRLISDPVLGMLLLGQDRLTQLSAGRPEELELLEVIDESIARSGGVNRIRLHRLGAADIDGDGNDDLLIFDELEHRLTVLGHRQDKLKPLIAWPVFDDLKYPYSDDSENRVREPRVVVAADFDGDRLQDLALLSQDRLLVYFAEDAMP